MAQHSASCTHVCAEYVILNSSFASSSYDQNTTLSLNLCVFFVHQLLPIFLQKGGHGIFSILSDLILSTCYAISLCSHQRTCKNWPSTFPTILVCKEWAIIITCCAPKKMKQVPTSLHEHWLWVFQPSSTRRWTHNSCLCWITVIIISAHRATVDWFWFKEWNWCMPADIYGVFFVFFKAQAGNDW